jgi:hypothetical protein
MTQEIDYYEQADREERQSSEAEAARQIVNDERDFSGWKRYMLDDCKVVKECTSPMCPLDIRLNPKEKENAELCCRIENRQPINTPNALTALVRKHCADYDSQENLCIGEHRSGTCLIMQDLPCPHFKKSVWPICCPSYQFASETAKYEKLFQIYKKIDPSIIEDSTRQCSCGQPMKSRQRYCETCKKARRKQTNKTNQRKYRKNRV